MIVVVFLALGAWGADLAPRQVVPTTGPVRVCWTPSPETPLLTVDGAPVSADQRCLATASLPRFDGAGEAVTPRSAGPFRWHGPAVEPGLLPDGVHQVTRAPDGNLWIARCRDGLTRLQPRTGARRTWTSLDGLPEGCITEVSVDQDGRAWAITPARVAIVDPVDGLVEVRPFTDDDASVDAVHVDAEGRAWLGGQGGRLIGEDARGGEPMAWTGTALGAPGTLHAIRDDPQGRLWLSSDDRITRLAPQSGRYDLFRASHTPGTLPPGRPGPVAHAPDGAWVVVQPERPGAPPGGLVHLPEAADAPVGLLALPGLPEAPLSVTGTADGALWLADGAGVVRVDPARVEARRLAVRDGFVPGGPWLVPGCEPDVVQGAWEGGPRGATLARLHPDGRVEKLLAPAPLPPRGVLIRADDGVLLATADGFFSLEVERATWRVHPGFGEGLRGWSARRLRVVHTGPTGRTWLAGEEGLRVGRVVEGFAEVELPGSDAVLDVLEGVDGTTWIATEDELLARDVRGTLLRVVDDRGRPVTGVERLTSGAGRVWAWGAGGAWTVEGSDAVRQSAGPVRDLVLDADVAWVARSGEVRRIRGERSERIPLPWTVADARQLIVRDGALVQVRTPRGLWRQEGEGWSRVIGVEGPFVRGGDGTLWRWDPDGLHVLPLDAAAWRWVGLREGVPLPGEDARGPRVAADEVAVHALDGALAVEVEGRIVGDPQRRDPILDLDVHGTRWAALSGRGVLLRGEGYRILERTLVPGPARRVAVGPHRVCVAGSTTWCREDGRWKAVWGVLDLAAPLPAVDLAVDEEDRAWMLQPGALCVEGEGCRRLRGPAQTSLLVDADGAWVGGAQGLWRSEGPGSGTLVRPGGPVLDLARHPSGALFLATEDQGLVRYVPANGEVEASEVVLGTPPDPGGHTGQAVSQVAVTRRGDTWLTTGRSRHVLDPGPAARRDRWPWVAAPTPADPGCSAPARP